MGRVSLSSCDGSFGAGAIAPDETPDAVHRLFQQVVALRVADADVAAAASPKADPGITATRSSMSSRSAKVSSFMPLLPICGNA